MSVDAGNKRLNEMNRLGDMGHFPVAVNAGATLNVLITVTVTWLYAFPLSMLWSADRRLSWFQLGPWTAIVLCVNLLPVVLLRFTLTPSTAYPRLRDMNFFRDQHKFSDWVYLAASANMAFWIALAWTFRAWLTPQSRENIAAGLIGLLLVAAFVTFSPVLLRVLRRRGDATLD